jgi:CRP/FNR family transcriptional regulator
MPVALQSDVLARARRAFSLLDGLEPTVLESFARAAGEIRLPAGEIMFRPGDGCDAFGFVVDGRVKVGLLSEQGRELVLYRVRPGESCTVTVSCLVSDRPYPALGVVEEDLTALAIPRAAFSDLVDRSPVFRAFVLGIFSARVTHLMALVHEVAFNKLDQRLAARLLELGPVVEMSHGERASELGTSREIVSRLLESLADDGAVSLGRRRIEVSSPALLELRRG